MDPNKLQIMRHSCAHLIAAAVKELYPEAKFGVGPVVENGFYYDIDFPVSVSEGDLLKIEDKAKELAKNNISFERIEMPIAEAVEFFKKQNQDYKVELLKDLEQKGTTKISEELGDLVDSVEKVSLYKTGNFTDLCRGPHVKSAKEIGDFKLMKIAGAYWRGDEKNKMLQRVYGVCFATEKELNQYLEQVRLSEERDHRKLGREMDLFVFSDLVGPGLPLYTFKGVAILEEIKKYINFLQKGIGYKEVQTPNMNRAELFKVSGHYEKYKDDMFQVISHYSKEEYYLKPMNCPQHAQIFASKPRSYKDLPVRIADFAMLYRDEKTGELSGLTRLRGFRQDDGHSFCREDQIKDEFRSVLSVIEKAMKIFGMNYKIRLSLWDPNKPEKYLGDARVWEKSQATLEEILVENKIEYFIGVGEAAIYGPKMDLISKDSLGREWQLSTIQLDFIMPERFDLKYIDSEGKEKSPVMVHRAIVGSPERFMAILIEHYGGAFPLWLSPVQILLAPVSSKHVSGAKEIAQELAEKGIRVEIDDADETVGNKVRKAAGQKIPYIIVVGDKELAGEEWMIRARGEKDQIKMSKNKFVEKVLDEIKERK